METQHQYPKPRPALSSKRGPSDSLDGSIQLIAVVDKESMHTKLTQQVAADRSNTLSMPSSPSESKDGNQVATSLPPSPDLMEMLETIADMLEENRTKTSQEGLILHRQLLSDQSEQARILDEMVRSRLEENLTHIKSMARPFVKAADLEAQLKAERNRYKQVFLELKDVSRKCKNYEQEILEANAKLEHALRERDLQRQRSDGTNLANSDKTTDDTIASKWKELGYNIHCLARALVVYPSVNDLDFIAERRLRFLSPVYLSIIRDEDYRDLIMRGFLWRFVQEDIFSSIHSVWGGPLARSLKQIQGQIMVFPDRVEERYKVPNSSDLSLAHVARWSAQGAKMIDKLWENSNKKTINDIVLREAQRLQPFYSLRGSRVGDFDKKIMGQLRDIIHSAIDLDKMTMCSKAIFQFCWKDDSQAPGIADNYNPEVMEAPYAVSEPTPQSRVQFYMSPTLIKIGTADGRKYNNRMVVAKANVVCD
ncbi:hypothetical protein FGRMN_8207 [Fusarium graminum]|nr:hypothetical protein FGRMN_8207 [Fusarium graminum]